MGSKLLERETQDEPLQLIEIQRCRDFYDGRIYLRNDNIDRVFANIGDRPISIICVCGPSRQGKSFLLGYMIRCLEGLEQEREDWMGWDEKNKPLKGFKFRNGTSSETQGIWIWSRPFIVKGEDGKEVAVILMDTQGTYDEFTTSNDMSAIVGLSLLISSVMIFNFFNNLQEDTITAMMTFIEYGSLALEHGQYIGTPFQKLVYLIRDWNNPGQFTYGYQGGKSFLEEKLKVKPGQPAEARHVRESIRKCFQDLDCFLMPTIGEKALYPKFKGSIDELAPKFAKEMEKFINSVVNAETLNVKEIMGHQITASGLRSCLEVYVDMFNSTIPSAETMWQATAQISNNILIEEVVKKYQDTLKRKLRGNSYLQDQDLDESHFSGKKLALDVFRREKKFGSPETIAELLEKLANRIQIELAEIKQENRDKRLQFMAGATTAFPNSNRPETQKRYADVQDISCKAVTQIKCMLPAATQEWLKNHLLPSNISDIKTVYDNVLQAVLSEARQYVDAAQWGKLNRIVDEQCTPPCLIYLCVIQRRIQKFYLGMKNKFDFVDGVSNANLQKQGKDELENVSCDLRLDNTQFLQLVEIGCSKLTEYFKAQNEEIIRNRDAFTENLIRDGLNFYDGEMERLLREAVYSSERLKEIHAGLSGKLLGSLGHSLNLTAGEEKVASFKTALEKSFVIHLQQNNTKMRKIQEEVKSIIEASKSAYVAKIENVMKENSDGVEASQFHKKHKEIAQEEVNVLQEKIQNVILQDEIFDKHLKSFQVYADDYWEYISELNKLNLRRRQLREQHEAKKLLTERKGEGDRDRGHQDGVFESKMIPEEGTANAGTAPGREHQLESEIANSSKSRQELLQLSHAMKEQLEGGTVFKIKSGVVKGLFAEKIDQALKIAQDPDSTFAQMQEQVETLKKWSSKYRK